MSPRAAWRLESLGFREVYDYLPGKEDWMGAGLPIEGAVADIPTLGSVARTDIPTCTLDEQLHVVRPRVDASPWDACVVVNDHNVVMGVLDSGALAKETTLTAEQAMTPGPTTFRPHIPVEEAAASMRAKGTENVLVTRSDGTLIGVALLADVERRVHAGTAGGAESETH